MNFLYPAFLFALTAIAIPIVVHLFSFRRYKKIFFTNSRFLSKVSEQTQSHSRLKHRLILLSRILAIAFLAMAFAQPYFSGENAKRKSDQAVSIYIDNSFSMESENKYGKLLDLAKKRAIEIAQHHTANSEFQLLTNDFEGRHQRFYDRNTLIEMIQEVSSGPRVKKLSEVRNRQLDLLRQSATATRIAYMISDFQTSTTDIETFAVDSSIQTILVPQQGQTSANLFIDSVWFRTPVRQLHQQEEMKVRIVNHTAEDLENFPMRLFINGAQKAVGTFAVESGASVDTTLFYTNKSVGPLAGKVSISDHPIIHDDDFFFGYHVAERINVLEVFANQKQTNNSAEYIQRVFQGDSLFLFNQMKENEINYSALNNYHLIILNNLNAISSGLEQALIKFVGSGGSLVLFPAEEISSASYDKLLRYIGSASTPTVMDTQTTSIDKIDFSHFLFSGVFEETDQKMDLPKINKHYAFSKTTRSSATTLLQMRNGNSFLSLFERGKGKAYLFAAPLTLACSNFPQHALFPTVLNRIAECSTPSEKLFFTIGKDQVKELRTSTLEKDRVFHLVNRDKSIDFVPEVRTLQDVSQLFFHNQIREAGNYEITHSEELVDRLAFNYSREESKFTTLRESELKDAIDERGDELAMATSVLEVQEDQINTASLDGNRELWKMALLLVAAFLAVETLLIKLWK